MSVRFLKDLPEMVDQEVISSDTATKIRLWYEEKAVRRPNRLLLISGVLGAILIGLGIILILAHNWDSFPKVSKTIIAFIPLAITQLLVIYSMRKKGEVLKESSGTLLFFSVGTSISLISQIYHLPGKMEDFLFTWMLLCAPLIYLLKSKSLTLLHLVFTTWWVVLVGYGYRSEIPWFYGLLFVWVVPFYFNLIKQDNEGNMTAIMNWILPLNLIISLGTFIDNNELIGFLMYALLFGILYQVGCLKMLSSHSLRKNGFKVLGVLGMIILLLITSFNDVWKKLPNEVFRYEVEIYISVGMFVILLLFILKHIQSNKGFNPLLYVPLVFTVIFFVGTLDAILATIFVNLLIFLMGVLFIRNGALEVNLGIFNFGLLVIVALIMCRFFDTDISFVLRGIIFVSVGIGFFIANYLMLKKKQELEKTFQR
ncbi:DUF2157 domain-containing protein [Ascidiimonas sp. W6]|uniref:DUF2157 domain-containing protein n=1 Tax=Ascidiimonas meishanensis TaxID=3128903 RepID=UPI0030EBE627